MTILPRHKDVAKSRLKMSNPWHLLAVGFGSGLSPIVPGTMGSLAAIPFWYLMTFLPWQLYSLVVMLGICIGVYLCHQTAKDMGVHDHGSIVWDEFIGMWITLMALPTNDWQWVAAGFVIFRILDMWKPWRFAGLIAMYMAAWGYHHRRYCRRGDFRRHPVLYRSSLRSWVFCRSCAPMPDVTLVTSHQAWTLI